MSKLIDEVKDSRRKYDVGSWIVPIIAVLTAMLVASVLMLIQGLDPMLAYKSLFTTAFGSSEGIAATLGKATPLVLSGLAVTLGLRAGLFNIGVQGQLLTGALASAWAGYALSNLPPLVHIALALAFGFFFGALVGAIAGYLKAFRGVHEVITTIMLNSIVMGIVDYLASNPFKEADQALTRTPQILDSVRLPMFGNFPSGFFLAAALAFLMWWILGFTTTGFRFNTVGRNRFAAWYAGISYKKAIFFAMLFSGGIAGLGGAVETLGITYRFEPAFNLGLGFDGITIALLGRVHPVGIIPGAILIGGMRAGAADMQFDAGVAPELVDLLLAMILFFVTAPLISRFFKNSANRSLTGGWGN